MTRKAYQAPSPGVEGVATVFDPRGIEFLELWLDGQDVNGNGVPYIAGTTVPSWKDKSGKGNHAAQATTADQPTCVTSGINGKQSLAFDTNDLLVVPDGSTLKYTTGMAVYIVYQRTVDSGSTQIVMTKYQSSASPTREFQWIVNSTDKFQFQGSTTGASSDISQTTTVSATTGTPYILHADHNGSNLMLGVNGANYLSVDVALMVNSTGQLSIGASATAGTSECQGYLGEVLMFTKALNAREHASVLNYLSAKWGITITTPVVNDVFVLSGQSNANGQADNSQLPAECVSATYSNFWIWDFNAVPAAWEKLQPGVNDMGATGKHGSEAEMGFLYNTLSATTGKTYYLVKEASGGKHLANADLGNSFYPITGTYWGILNDTVMKPAMNAFRKAGVLACIDKFYWMQGESDTADPTWAAAYSANLAYFIAQEQALLYQRGFAAKTVKFIVGHIYTDDLVGYPGRDVVRSAQSVVMRDVNNGALVEVKGLTFNPPTDNVHLDGPGQKGLATLFFNAG